MPQLQILAGFRFVENSLYSNVRTIKNVPTNNISAKEFSLENIKGRQK